MLLYLPKATTIKAPAEHWSQPITQRSENFIRRSKSPRRNQKPASRWVCLFVCKFNPFFKFILSAFSIQYSKSRISIAPYRGAYQFHFAYSHGAWKFGNLWNIQTPSVPVPYKQLSYRTTIFTMIFAPNDCVFAKLHLPRYGYILRPRST